ncbi:MAG: hypothetical protein J6V42_05835 [Clostridia bacterium]|nr:hypothetical protein [Clostridia bacterium]
MQPNNSDAQRLLAARLEDYLRISERGELVCGNFLTPAESVYLISVAKEMRCLDRIIFLGGFSDAERKMIIGVPPFVSQLDGELFDNAKVCFEDEMRDAVKAIKITGSGYRELSHRDYLGSILSLGVERASLGDIVVLNEHSAVVFCTGRIFTYLIGSTERIGSDKVTVEEFVPDEDFDAKREFLPIRDTVASERLDCVVGALANLSREKAQALIRSGLCEVDYLVEERVDVSVKAPCIVTLRGYGKYRVLEFDGETRRGRLRLVAQKYI